MDVLTWPTLPSDLNPMEALWRNVEVALGRIWGRGGVPEALEAAAWNSISEERLEELMPTWLQAVTDANGYPTPASLRWHGVAVEVYKMENKACKSDKICKIEAFKGAPTLSSQACDHIISLILPNLY